MHTPDGFITSWICIVSLIFSLTALAYSFYMIKKTISKKLILNMAAVSGLIFSMQMLNIPLGINSVHFIGTALAVILLGPFAAIISSASVLVTQAILFSDGGITTLPFNITSMSVIAAIAAHYTYIYFKKTPIAIALASAASVLFALAFTSLGIFLSNSIQLYEILSTMLTFHAGAILIEASITLILIRLHKNLVLSQSHMQTSRTLLYIAIATLFATPFASVLPDALEHTGIVLGFNEKAISINSIAPLASYQLSAISGAISSVLAGIIGIIAVYSLTYLIGLSLVKWEA